MINSPTLDQLKHGIRIAEQIAALEAEMAALFNGSTPTTPTSTESPSMPVKKKGGMSAAGRARIAAAQKLRWAKAKGTKASEPVKPEAPAKKKGGLSEAGRKRLALSMKKRWAAAKAGQAPAPTAGKK